VLLSLGRLSRKACRAVGLAMQSRGDYCKRDIPCIVQNAALMRLALPYSFHDNVQENPTGLQNTNPPRPDKTPDLNKTMQRICRP